MQTADTRWLVITADGRHSTLGRHTDPSEREVEVAADLLCASGIPGWLAVMRGRYYGPGDIELLVVKALGAPSNDGWSDAELAFRRVRRELLLRS